MLFDERIRLSKDSESLDFLNEREDDGSLHRWQIMCNYCATDSLEDMKIISKRSRQILALKGLKGNMAERRGFEPL